MAGVLFQSYNTTSGATGPSCMVFSSFFSFQIHDFFLYSFSPKLYDFLHFSLVVAIKITNYKSKFGTKIFTNTYFFKLLLIFLFKTKFAYIRYSCIMLESIMWKKSMITRSASSKRFTIWSQILLRLAFILFQSNWRRSSGTG